MTNAKTKSDKPFDTVGFIMDWESGDMDEEREVEGFQYLIDSGTIYHLQGAYGRRAQQLIDAGLLHRPKGHGK